MLYISRWQLKYTFSKYGNIGINFYWFQLYEHELSQSYQLDKCLLLKAIETEKNHIWLTILTLLWAILIVVTYWYIAFKLYLKIVYCLQTLTLKYVKIASMQHSFIFLVEKFISKNMYHDISKFYLLRPALDALFWFKSIKNVKDNPY